MSSESKVRSSELQTNKKARVYGLSSQNKLWKGTCFRTWNPKLRTLNRRGALNGTLIYEALKRTDVARECFVIYFASVDGS